MHQLNQTPNYHYLSHPINSFHLIRHIASGWNNIMKNVLGNEVNDSTDALGRCEILSKFNCTIHINKVYLVIFNFTYYLATLMLSVALRNWSKEKLPGIMDVNGAAHGVVRLWSMYR